MAMVVVMAALVGAGVWAAVRLEGHMDTPATLAGQPRPAAPSRMRRPAGHATPADRRRPEGPELRTSAPATPGGRGTSAAAAGTPPASGPRALTADPSAGGLPVPARRRGYALTAAVLLLIMLGGTLPVPLYVLYEQQMGFGPLGVTVVFAAYVLGTLSALVALGDLSDHVGRRKVLALAVRARRSARACSWPRPTSGGSSWPGWSAGSPRAWSPGRPRPPWLSCSPAVTTGPRRWWRPGAT